MSRLQHILDAMCPINRLVRQVKALPDGQQPAAVEALVRHRDAAVRMWAADVAHRLGNPQAAVFCEALLSDPVAFVRRTACERARAAPLPGTAAALLHIVERDGDEDARFAAAFALGRAGSEQHIPEMLRLAEVVQGANHEGTTVRSCLLVSVEEVRGVDVRRSW